MSLLRRAVASLLLLVIASCRSTPVPQHPDVLLVVVDTLRQDRVGAYGYDKPTTPTLDAFAATAQRYANARSTSGWTTPSHASMFTGLYAASHGATQERWVLGQEHTTLAEHLKAHGYATRSVNGNPMLSGNRGFRQGFDTWRDTWRAKDGASGTDDDRAAAAVARIAQDQDGKPLFLFVNLIGVHSPYDSCGEYCGTFGAKLKDGATSNQWQSYYLGRRDLADADFERMSKLYDAEVRKADAVVQQILAAMQARNNPKGTVVLITADHGENLGEHGHVDHVFSLYDTTVRVPLLLRAPGMEPGISHDPVQLVDIAPTLVDLAGMPPLPNTQGRTLRAPWTDRPAFFEYYRPRQAAEILSKRANAVERQRLHKWKRRLRAVVDGSHKLIWADDGSRELFDLSVDAQEAQNLASSPDAVARLAQMNTLLDALYTEYARAEIGGAMPTTDDATRSALESLGYVE